MSLGRTNAIFGIRASLAKVQRSALSPSMITLFVCCSCLLFCLFVCWFVFCLSFLLFFFLLLFDCCICLFVGRWVGCPDGLFSDLFVPNLPTESMEQSIIQPAAALLCTSAYIFRGRQMQMQIQNSTDTKTIQIQIQVKKYCTKTGPLKNVEIQLIL